MDVPASVIDLLVIPNSGDDTNTPSVSVVTYDTGTRTASEVQTVTIPQTNPPRRPDEVVVVGTHVYVTSPTTGEILRLELDVQAPGLTFVEAVGGGSSTKGIAAVGSFLYTTNLPNFLNLYSIAGDGSLTANGSMAAGENFPKNLLSVVLGNGQTALYLTTSNNVTGYIVDTNNGQLSLLNAGQQFTGFQSPEAITD